MKIVWSREARDDLLSIRRFVGVDNPIAAGKLVSRIIDFTESMLRTAPNCGRIGRVAGTRELIIARTAYIVAYRFKDSTIEIIRVYHGARKWPDAF
jgi:toxin ParE1/3/4